MKYLKILTVTALALTLSGPVMAKTKLAGQENAKQLTIYNGLTQEQGDITPDVLVLVFLAGGQAANPNYVCDADLSQELLGNGTPIVSCKDALVSHATQKAIGWEGAQIASIEVITRPETREAASVKPILVGKDCMKNLNQYLNGQGRAQLGIMQDGNNFTCTVK